jgi:hypothetical protein
LEQHKAVKKLCLRTQILTECVKRGKGNAEHNLKWRLSLAVGTYYFSVQAIDASYAGSAFSSPVQFKVTALGIDSDSDGDGLRIH